MSRPGTRELLFVEEAGRMRLGSPGVGEFSHARAAGSILAPGDEAGVLTTLGVPVRLIVPEGARGLVLSKPPRRTREPVQYGQTLYELGALELDGESALPSGHHGHARAASTAGINGELVVPAPQAGRFYHKSAPGEPALCAVGRELENGAPIGLIEVMKTFTQVIYRAERGLPARATIVRVIAPDAGDVEEGGGLIVVEPR